MSNSFYTGEKKLLHIATGRLAGTEEIADGFAIMFSHPLGMTVIIDEQGTCSDFSVLVSE